MALDGEDYMANNDASISDANEENHAEGVARQTASAGLQKSLQRFEVLDHPRPVEQKGIILQN